MPDAFDRVPPEVLDEIIDQVAGGVRSPYGLEMLQTVNKRFANHCQRYRLPRLRFNWRSFNLWCQDIQKNHSAWVLGEPRKSPLRYVIHIHYSDDPFIYNKSTETRRVDLDRLDYYEFNHTLHSSHEEYLSYLINVSELRVDNTYFPRIPNFKILGSTVRLLELKHCTMKMDELLTFLGAFTRLNHLIIANPAFTPSQQMQMSEPLAQGPALPLHTARITTAPGRSAFGFHDEKGQLNSLLSRSGADLTTVDIHCEYSVLRTRRAALGA